MSRGKVFLVEDELLLANNMKYQLMELGYEITGIATRADETLNKLDALYGKPEFPDAIITDISLAGKINGLELGRILNEKYEIAIIYISGLGQLDYIEEILKIKPQGYLIKPFDSYFAHINIQLALNQLKLEKEVKRLQEEISRLKSK
jgi:DNA-binding NtrC family response regulator